MTKDSRPKDSRLYAKLTLEFAEHPKIAILSDQAFRAIIEMLLYRSFRSRVSRPLGRE